MGSPAKPNVAAVRAKKKQQRAEDQPEARLDAIGTYLRYTIWKTHTFRYTILHISAFLVLSFLAFLLLDGRVTTALRINAEIVLLKDQAVQGKSADDVAQWFVAVLPNLGRLQKTTAADLASFAPIAQTRYQVRRRKTVTQVCTGDPQLNLLDPAERTRIIEECQRSFALYPSNGAGTLFIFPWPTTDAQLNASATNFESTVLRDDNTDVIVTIPLFMDASAAMTVATVTYTAGEGDVKFLVSTPGVMHFSQIQAKMSIPMLVILFFLIIAVGCEIVIDFRLEKRISPSVLNALTLKFFVEVCFILTAGAWFGLTLALFFIWNAPGDRGLTTADQAFDAMVLGTAVYDAAKNIFAVWYILLFLRSFFYLRFWSRFSVLSDTVVSAGPALIGCLLTLLALIAAFACVGSLMYGHSTEDDSFRTTGTSIEFIFVFLYRGGALDYGPFIDEEPFTATLYFFLLHFWVQIIVLNVIIGVIASAFSAVVTSSDLVRSVAWDPRQVRSDFWHYLRRFKDHHDDNDDVSGDVPLNGICYVEARIPLLQHVQARLRREPGSTPVRVDDLLDHTDELEGYTDEQRRQLILRTINKAANNIGNSDGIDRGFKLSVQDSKRSQRMEADFWRQARIIHDLYSSICGASTEAVPQLRAEAAVITAAEANLQRSADLLQDDRARLEDAIREALHETDVLRRELDRGLPVLGKIAQTTRQFKDALHNIRKTVENAEINMRRPTPSLSTVAK
jgi:hypothetical protein